MIAKALLILALLATPSAMAADRPLVQTATGLVRGQAADRVEHFLGIPFAAPPVGPLRWRPPAAMQPWPGVRDAATNGPDCLQNRFIWDDAPLATTPSEDCLYLNVWRPQAAASKPLPVMVWVHGGGFLTGGTSPAIYDGSALARDGVVVVSANYRLGRFGFFAHPALSAEAAGGPNANYGLMDQIAALRWVATNIRAFGGDPGNVTLFGESAGGKSVNMLLTSPLARGLFHKAIAMSGGSGASILPLPALAQAEATGALFAHHQGIDDNGPTGLAALRALPAAAVLGDLSLTNREQVQDYSGPVIDGALVTGEPLALMQAGQAAIIPYLVGANSDDGWHHGGTKEQVLAWFGPLQAEARALYDPTGTDTAEQVGHRVWGDNNFREPARATARAMAAAGAPVYLYRFSYVAEQKRPIWPGTQHAKELPFIFDHVPARYGSLTTKADLAAAARFRTYWTGFARTGIPASPGMPAAPRLTLDHEQLMDFSNQGPVVITDPLQARLDLMARRVAAP